MDQVLFTMPSNLRDFLIATAIVQELQVQMIYGASKEPPVREQNFTITIRLDEKYKYLEPCLQVVKNLVPTFDYSGWNEYSRGEFTNFVEFDFELAKRIAKPNKKHITEAFGVKIGTYLNALFFGMFPSRQCNLGPLMLPKRNPEDKIKVAVYEWDFDSTPGFKLKTFVESNYPELEVSYLIPVVPLCELSVLFKTVNSYDIVIHQASETTYIAAALEKAVIEIFPSDEECWLYNNKGLPVYACTVGNPKVEYMWYLFENMYAQFTNQEALSVQAS